jgi:hypothetical protein
LTSICPEDAGRQAGNDFQQRALAAAARPDDGNEVPGLNLEGDAIQRRNGPGAAGKNSRDFFDGDQRRHLEP